MRTQTLGRFGEDLAVSFLRDRGYVILDRNVRSKVGEIDIVARDGDVEVFVEVKTRSDQTHGRPEEFVTPSKLKKFVRAAERYMYTSSKPHAAWRIDVVSVDLAQCDSKKQIEHFKNITL